MDYEQHITYTMKEKINLFQRQISWLLPKAFLILALLAFNETYSQPPCTAIATNFSENFDTTPTGGTTNPSVPDCWSYIDNMSTTGYGYTASSTTTVISPPNFFRFYRMCSTANVNEDLTLVSPETVNLGNGTKQVRFYARGNSATVTSILEVVRLNGNTSAATATVLATFNITGTSYSEYIVPLPATTDDYFGFRVPHNGSATTNYPYAFIDDVFYEDLETCFFPTNATVSAITQNTATISWTASIDPNITTYDYEVRSSGTPGSGATGLAASGNTAGVSANITGLSPSVNYTVYVRSVCGTSTGRWNPQLTTFQTLCGVVTGNFYEGFDTTATGTTSNNNFPNCWSYVDDVTTTGYGYVNAANAQSGSNSYRLYKTNTTANQGQNLILISPETSNLGNGTKQLRFSVRAGTATNVNNLEIVTANGDDTNATFTVIRTINVDYVTYQEYIIPLPATTDDYFGFRLAHNGTTTLSTIHLDDIYYEDLADCFFPTALSIANITQTSVDLSWTASVSTSVTGYEYEVRSSGAPGSGAVGLDATGIVTGTSTTVTGLSPSLEYTVYIRSICGTTEGIWNPVSQTFNTLCGVVTGNLYENFDTTAAGSTSNATYPNCWSYIDDVTSTGYGYVLNSTTYAQSPTQSFRLYRTNSTTNAAEDLVLISPETDNLGNGNKQLRFSVRSYLTSYTNKLEIISLADNTTTANATVLATIYKDDTAYQEYIVPLPATTDDYFAFRMAYNGLTAASSVVIDDVYYEDLSPCIFPMNINAIAITGNTATISWDASLATGVTGYEYEIRTSGDAGSGAVGLETSGTVTGTSVNITGLDPATQYFVYVRSICGLTNGIWTTFPVNFYTLCGIVTGNFYEGFDTTETGTTTNNNFPYCWSYVDEVVSTGYGYVNAVNAQSPSNSYRMYRTNTVANQGQNLRLISPETDNLGNGNWVKQVRFSVRGTSTSPQILEVFTANGTTSAANFTVLDTITINSTTYQEYTVYLPHTTDDFFGFNLPHNGTTIAGTVHIDDVYYENTPSCKPILSKDIIISNVSKNGAAISWIDIMNLSSVSYMVEVRETGNPGDPGASFIGTTAPGVTTINATALNPSTKYSVYVKVLCSATDESIWTYGGDLQTLCDYPDFVSYTTSSDLCGSQKAMLDAVLTDQTAEAAWYDAENDIVPLYVGPNFVSDTDVTQDRSFWLRSRKLVPDSDVQIGDGTLSAVGNQTFLYHLWGGYKHQYIFTAAELSATGLTAGPITALKFDVVTVGTPNRNDFSISLGTTTQTAATTTHIDNNNLSQVYSNVSETFAVGIKTFTFATPYLWDGVSNIVVQTVWSNQNTGGGSTGGSGALRYHTTDINMNTYTWADNRTAAEFISTLTGNVNGSGGTSTNSGRPNTVFVGVAGCISPAIEIPVTVAPKPAFELSTDKVISCDGDISSPVTITTNLGGYDTFIWTPSTGVSGDEVNGWTFNTNQEQKYTLTASQSNGICEQIKTVLVTAGIKPEPNTNLATVHNVCKNTVTELNVLESLPNSATIGNLTTTTAPTSEVSAFVQSSAHSKQQYIYSAAELQTQGLTTAGYITELAFETINSGSSMTNDNYVVKMMLSPNTTFPDNNFVAGNFHTVYSATTHTHTFQGAQNIVLDHPFYWDGQSNIIVQITQQGTGVGNNAETYFTSSTGNVGLYSSGATDADPISGSITTDRLDLTFGLEQSKVTWSPAANLYLDAATTIPYTNGTNALTVYTIQSLSGTQVYTALLTAPSGCSTSVDYTINVADVRTPIVQGQTFCEATPVTDVVVTGHQGATLIFYDTATGTTPITTISQTGTYYVEAVLGSCKSARIPFTATITPLDLPTALFTQIICGSGTIADLTATGVSGSQINWYDSATSTTVLSSTHPLVDNTTYYAAQQLGNCESGRIAVLVSINTTPLPALTSQTITVCGDLTYGSIDLNQISGSELIWYPSATSQTPIPNTGSIVSGTYYVSQKLNNCESARVQITVTSAQSTVPAPTAGVQNICGSGTVAQLSANILPNAIALWYSDATSTTPLQLTDVLVSGTYYLAQQEGNCISPKIPVAVRVTNTAAPDLAPFTLCEGSTVADLTISEPTGVSHKWFINSSSTTELPLTDILISGYYFVVRVENGCESARTQVQVTINSRPESPTGASPQTFTDYAEISNLIMDEPNVIWYITYEDALNGINPLNQDMPLVNGTTYYAVIIGVNGCPSLPTPIETIIVLGINDFDLSKLKYYPNPVNDLLTITYADVITNVEVFDLNGRMVIKRDFDNQTVQLDFSNLSAGTYMLNIKTKENSQFVKIVEK